MSEKAWTVSEKKWAESGQKVGRSEKELVSTVEKRGCGQKKWVFGQFCEKKWAELFGHFWGKIAVFRPFSYVFGVNLG